MAKAGTPVKEEKKPNVFKRILNAIVGFFLGIFKAFRNTYFELKKVTWATKHDLMVYSVVTLGFMVFMGIIILVIDLGSAKLIDLLLTIG